MEWTQDLSTGVNEIDDQHKELFLRINSLLDSCRQGRGKAEVGKVIIFLEDYVLTHFGTEEKYMIESGYPDFVSHKAQHTEFIANFSELKGKFQNEGVGVHVVLHANRLVVDWLINHIRKKDKSLGGFLKTNLKT